MCIELLGISTARPPGVLTQDQALELNLSRLAADTRRAGLLKRLYRRSSVKQRASVLAGESSADISSYYPPLTADNGHGPPVSQRMRRYEQEALPLAIEACKKAIGAGNIRAEDIAQVVTVSCTGFASPGIDSGLIRHLQLSPTIGRSAIGFMGCHGAINGMRVASALAQASPGTCVLLCAVELCTLHFHYGMDEGRAVANTLFADGAAAAILRTRGAEHPATNGAWRLRATGSCLLPDSVEDMGWRIGDHGFEMTLSSRVPSIIGSCLRDWLASWLKEHGLAPERIGSWAIHPGGPRVIDTVERTLGLMPRDTEPSRAVLAECGNMSSPTVLFILRRLAERDAPRPCVTLAFGPGLVVEAALLD